ncbi:hypothetical protein GS937_07970 [Rhodococcus hoagii]|nr:hypothetical protein [Prescottella equi]
MRRRSCVETSSVVRAASEMNTWELEQAIAALGARERELLIAGDVEAAAADRGGQDGVLVGACAA